MNSAKLKNLLTSRYFYIGITALAVLVFLLQNNKPVEIKFFFWEIANANLFGLLILFFLIGLATGFFGSKIQGIKKKTSSKIFKKDSGRITSIQEEQFSGKPLQ